MKQLFILLFVLLNTTFSYAQNKLPNTLNVFYDYSNYNSTNYFDFIRQEMNKINFVRDREDADVHIMLKSNYSDAGNELNTLFVIGKKKYASLQDTLHFVIPAGSTEHESRTSLVLNIKKALLPYLLKTTLAENISVNLKKDENATTDNKKDSVIKDPFNFWVFKLGLTGNVYADQTFKESSYNGYFNANRETEKTKSYISTNINKIKDTYILPDTSVKVKFQNINFWFGHAKKINEHWAVGIDAGFTNSIYSNYKIQAMVGPKIEYSIFPYKNFNNKRWIVAYNVNAGQNFYYDTTIYNKTKEFLTSQSLNSIFSYTQPWGSVNIGAYWSNYWNDFRKNNLSFVGGISTKVTKGLNFAIWGNYYKVQDQINISKYDPSLNNRLLKSNELLSNFKYSLGIGFSYRFGSKNNNIVNPIYNGLNINVNL